MNKVRFSLTDKEIFEAFPNEQSMVRELLDVRNTQISYIKEQIRSIKSNKKYDEWTKRFLVIVVDFMTLRSVVSDINRLNRYIMRFSKDKNNEQSLDIAKSVPIETLFELKKQKNTSTKLMCCCPLPGHQEKTASFCIYKKTNTFYCFGCHVGGDSLKFIMEYNGVSFKEALSYLNKL